MELLDLVCRETRIVVYVAALNLALTGVVLVLTGVVFWQVYFGY